MRNGKYFLFFLLLLFLEIIISFLLFVFAVKLRNEYVIFSLSIIILIIAYLFYGRYREKIKVQEKKIVFKKYSKNIAIMLLVLSFILGISILAFGIYLLIKAFSA